MKNKILSFWKTFLRYLRPPRHLRFTKLGTSVVCLTRTSASNKIFAIWESSAKGTFYGKDVSLAAAADCNDAATGAPAGFVQTGW